MSDTWFDPTFIKNYNRDILPHINNLEEGFFLQREKQSQALERAMSRVKRDRTIKRARNKVRQERAVHAAERGEARKMDILSGQPVSGKNAGGFYEAVENVFENKMSGKTKKRNEKFRGFDDFRKDFRLSTRTSIIGDDKEKDKLRKREERRLETVNEFFSIQSFRIINEEEDQQEEQPNTEQEETTQEEGNTTETNAAPLPFEYVFEQLISMRNKVKNVFENLSNISYKLLTEKYGIKSVNKDDKEFQLENALIFISRVCSGASDTEIQMMQNLQNGRLFDFSEESFDSARKLLLQLGETCFQTLAHVDEYEIIGDTQGSVRTQIMCGENKFKLVTGKVYIKETTNSPNYGVRNTNIINSLIQSSIVQDPQMKQFDQMSMFIEPLKQQISSMNIQFLINDTDPMIMTPEAMQFLSNLNLLDQNGQILEQYKLSSLNNLISSYASQVKNDMKTFKKSFFIENLKKSLILYFIRGNNQIDQRANASHLLTDSGLFIINDELINAYVPKSEIKFTAKIALNTNRGRKLKGSSIPKVFEKNKAIVEEIENQMQPEFDPSMLIVSANDFMMNIETIFYSSILNDFNIEFTLSLNPGNSVESKERNKNEYNIIKIKDKEYRIPVVLDKGDLSTQTLKEEFEEMFNIREKVEIILEKLEGHEKNYSKKTSHHRSNRNKARRAAEEKWGKAAIKGKDVDHKDGNPMNNSPSNLRLRNPSDNRADNGHHKGEPYKKAKRGITNTYKGKDK
jgi:hypothetical protein